MSTYVPPKAGVQFIFYAALVSQSDAKLFQTNPTIASGDFKISTDGSSLQNMTTLPSVDPAGGKLVKFTISAAEMTGANIQIVGSDAAGAEWCDIEISIQTSARQVDDLTYPSYQLPDSVATDGTRPTIEQALYEIIQFLTEKSLSGTTLTVKKVDGSTSLMTFTLDNATSPTSITRAS